MDELAAAVQQLDSILKPGLTPEELNAALGKVFEHAKDADADARDRALAKLADRVATIPLGPASFLAIGCGALVELGADPQRALTPILARAREALAEATVFAEACQARALSAPEPDNLDTDDAQACVEAFGQQVGDRMPEQADAWLAAGDLLRAMTALLSRSASARASARNDQDRISGVADNFQLDVLLAAALIGDPEQGWLPGSPPDPQVVAAAKDGPPGDSSPTATRAFKLVNWHGLRPDGTLAAGTDDHAHWIWSEGVPADIAALQGRRIVLVAPPAYPAAFDAGRRFPGMVGDLRVVETLAPEEVHAWLRRIAAAVESAY
jgi:hypothetical protein